MELSRPNLVEACDIGVVGGDDIALDLPWAKAHVSGNQVWGNFRGYDAKEDFRFDLGGTFRVLGTE